VDDGEAFIREAAHQRGIDPDIAVRVMQSEGGTQPPGKVGKFSTGWSFWPPQLHYGGADYPQFGTVAGMGNAFTALTGWQPGDPRAWADAVRYALNRAKVGGWGPWYGAAAVGITGFDGIDRSTPWDASAERWDFETGIPPMPAPTYNPDTPLILQNDDWSCWATSARMALESWGRHPSESWIESTTIADGIESPTRGLLDGSGAAGAAWLTRQYNNPAEGTPTITAHAVSSVTFDDVRSLAGTTALLLGGHHWGAEGHWCFVRRYEPTTDALILGNPAGQYVGVGQAMSRQQFGQVAPCSLIVVTADGAVVTPPAPPAPDPKDAIIAQLQAQVASLKQDLDTARSRLGVASVDYANGLQDLVNALRALRPPAA